MIPTPLLIITAIGFTATVAQIIFFRELLVTFYGNELSAGLIFTGWLLWSGLGSGLSGKWALKLQSPLPLLRLLLVGLAAILPLSVLFIRATRILGMLPFDELPSIGAMLLLSLAATGLFCPISGALFGICWAMHRQPGGYRGLAIYLGEALGAAAGGLVFYFVFLHFDSVFTTLWIISGMLLAISWWCFRPWLPASRIAGGHLLWMAVTLLLAAGAIYGSQLERHSRRWQWGATLLAVHDTAYQNLAMVKKEDQVSVFANGLWVFSEPDRLSAEHGAHLPLLQHPDPRTVLLLGGGVAGILEALLEHEQIQSIDYVEPDPDVIDLLKPNLSPAAHRALAHSKVNRFHQDPRAFLGQSRSGYDVILMSMGDPITAQMNRFYTLEFFARVKQRLAPGGIFSFAVSGGESMLGPTQARFLASIHDTLRQIFPQSLIYPGDRMRFFATDSSGSLLSDPSALAHRIRQRNLDLIYVREDGLADALSPFRLDYLQTILKSSAKETLNRDFFPICYFHTLSMWAAQWHEILRKGFEVLVDFKLRWIWTMLGIIAGGMVFLFRTGRWTYHLAVMGSVSVIGAMEMAVQVILLLSFQIIAGYLYLQLALIIAAYMTGLAIGAAWVSHWRATRPEPKMIGDRFIGVQSLVCLLPFALMLSIPLIQGGWQHALSSTTIAWLFSGLALITGFLGGIHFGLAVLVLAGTGMAFEKIGGELYALDLAGSAAGVLVTTLFILPIYGMMNTLMLMGGIGTISLLTLLGHPRELAHQD